MTESRLNPYLAFNGNTREAMEFYKDVLGGKLELQTYSEAGQDMGAEHANQIMHATLEAGDVLIMASDSQPGRPTKFDGNVSLSLQGADKEGLKKVFDALADGGNVMLPLEEQFWGDTFGMLADKYGVTWMVNIAKE